MCFRCLAAQSAVLDCDEPQDLSFKAQGTGGSSTGPTVTDERSILYYLDGGGNFRWNANDALGTSVTVTYSFLERGEFPSTSSYSGNPYGASSFSTFTDAQRNNFRQAAAEFMAVSGIVLIETDGDGDIDVFNAHGTYVGGYAELPYVSGSYKPDVDLVVDSRGDYDKGSYGYHTILHELGHAVGLDHTHEGAYNLAANLDDTSNTVMSYNYDNGSSGLQHIDIAALQTLYGSSSISSGWKLMLNEAAERVDGRGTSSNDVFVVSKVAATEARTSKIFGYEGDDTLVGKSDMDVLRGNQGNDALDGVGGNDRLRGGGGNDTIYGGSGEDMVHGGAGDDLLFGGAGNDIVIGASGSDHMHGGDGNDALYGRLNDDTLSGGAGHDTIDGGGGDDVLSGGGDIDEFIFRTGSGHDRISDFDAAHETLAFIGLGASLADVQISSINGSARITVGDAVLDLDGVSVSEIGADNFVFG